MLWFFFDVVATNVVLKLAHMKALLNNVLLYSHKDASISYETWAELDRQ